MNMMDDKSICADSLEYGRGRMKVRKIIVPRVKSDLSMAQIKAIVSEMMAVTKPKKSTKKKTASRNPSQGENGRNLSGKKMICSKSKKVAGKRAMDIIKIKGLG